MIGHLAAVFRHPRVGTSAGEARASFAGLVLCELTGLLSFLDTVETEEQDTECDNNSSDTESYA